MCTILKAIVIESYSNGSYKDISKHCKNREQQTLVVQFTQVAVLSYKYYDIVTCDTYSIERAMRNSGST